MTVPIVERDETNPQEADRLMGRSATALPSFEYTHALRLLDIAETEARMEPDLAKRAMALTTVACGFVELGRVYGWGVRR